MKTLNLIIVLVLAVIVVFIIGWNFKQYSIINWIELGVAIAIATYAIIKYISTNKKQKEETKMGLFSKKQERPLEMPVTQQPIPVQQYVRTGRDVFEDDSDLFADRVDRTDDIKGSAKDILSAVESMNVYFTNEIGKSRRDMEKYLDNMKQKKEEMKEVARVLKKEYEVLNKNIAL